MSKIMINVRELQAVKNGIMRFDTETKNFEVLDENGNWVESNAGVYNIESATTVERADNVVSAGTITNAYTGTVINVGASDTFVVMTQAEYDALTAKNENTFYLIEDE